ncbi:hypothetical protein LTR10_020748 [Elasticomyces elasticus]|uniref:SHSP domain-containing protein n=1 Tax=Exophiala sideris TaxID=1016849 RepID=A0ABR0J815_9EURO|nr:hypothetical protein LTR10_020748 [Elasticomyces elasticus]KAK5028868.1 hypothetical protein LTS07_006248 [Exophiala sideris]KAK5035737.1 hypothetical protein LTR13_005867 [Exophiala sideris]KAK5057372.1 hypothetical protein LTR69_007412 [Exophiala sideris]KAK5181654.1 hypothetical protein LTR44_005853 [Eurotiomycetes sp. CCFEE 6388]
MSFFYAYPTIEPYPTTHVAHTYPEKGHHLHHIPIPYLVNKAHKVLHDHDAEIHMPKADIRETLKNFYLEVELPGIKDKSELHLRWTSTRTLLVTSKTHRPEIPESDLLEEHAETAATTATTTTGTQATLTPVAAPGQTTAAAPAEPAQSKECHVNGSSQIKKEAHLTVHERPIGDVMRAFSFPVDVDRDETHAKLDAGLLKIIVPKSVHGKPEDSHVQVPVHDEAEEPGVNPVSKGAWL